MRLDHKLITIIVSLLIIVFIGFLLGGCVIEDKVKILQHYPVRAGGFKYINPLFFYESAPDSSENRVLKPFRLKVEKFITDDLDRKWADDVSVYFRQLNYGVWFSIGDTEKFYPASLLKVPLMIAVLKEAEADPTWLAKMITYSGYPDYNAMQNFKPSKVLEAGESYPVDELLRRMIVYSDNNAADLLEDNVDPEMRNSTYDDLSISDPYYLSNQADYRISAKAYVSFYRVLFNASYLSKNMSEKALELLTMSEFNTGMVAGVPSGIPVAHKFGENTMGLAGGIKELHDCGIVYYPGNPYLLCVMTSGKSFEQLDVVIREISRVIYEEISRQSMDDLIVPKR